MRDPHPPSKDERDFVRVVQFGTALGLGLMVGFLYSIKRINPDLQLEFGFGVVAAFLITAVFAWIFCGVLFKGEFSKETQPGRRVRRWLILFLTISGLATAGAFLYSLKGISSDSRRDVIEGTAIALCVLVIGGVLIHKSVRFFEEQDRANLAQHEQDKEQDDEEK